MKFNIIYKGERLGKGEQVFLIYKFRTMIENADELLEDMVKESGRNSLGKIINDPRVTTLGKILRRYGLDEIPQIVNLLRGEMCIVGIRPRDFKEWEYYDATHKKMALNFKPGVFSPAYIKINIKSSKELEEIERVYLIRKLKNPFSTDFKYFFLILWGLLNGARSV